MDGKVLQDGPSFLTRASYDTLPCPRNLHWWLGMEETCNLCRIVSASLTPSLTQGWFRWRRDQVLKKLVEVVERRRLETTKESAAGSQDNSNLAPDTWFGVEDGVGPCDQTRSCGPQQKKSTLLIELTVP